MGEIIVGDVHIHNSVPEILGIGQDVQLIEIDKEQAITLHDTIEVHFDIPGTHELYEKAIRALIVAEAPEFSPNGVVKDMDATNERKFADSTPVLLVAHIFGKKNTQVAADVIGQAREPKDV